MLMDNRIRLVPYIFLLVLFLSGCSIFQENPSEQLSPASSRILKLNYDGFTLWLDYNRRGAVKFRYTAQRDTGNFKRNSRFFLDPNVPPECQQTSTKAYGNGYDRGHLAPANHLDYSVSAIKASNTMTNILPQVSAMNRGAWELTEEIVECYRDMGELLVIGGVIWGDNPSDDYFIQSHGIKTPDAFWKVVIQGTGQDERVIAWVVPNSSEATKKRLDQYLVSIDNLEDETGEKIPVVDPKHAKPDVSWLIPYGCDRG
ncbi:DNA/RNA endonuclease G, NUC1 [Methyloglobulus morosus KoM1]|uniref:DNA/RNA endonuclease G, NUC1 n=1 Tax=Methyloglobulus morosus KoM1 TaxID=1116472 RepID=V5BE32_9GAMM|nr:DNA/RNA endonuclease G, NUC1 [Methyloglobulus morosus KoM1]